MSVINWMSVSVSVSDGEHTGTADRGPWTGETGGECDTGRREAALPVYFASTAVLQYFATVYFARTLPVLGSAPPCNSSLYLVPGPGARSNHELCYQNKQIPSMGP